MNHLRRGVWLACAALCLLATGLFAQESRGSISGRVIDAQGGVLPSATITVVNVGTAATTTITTNAVGQYTALLLEPGSYRVTADALGRWAYHCHLLFHMEAGMFREVRVEE